MSKASVLSKIWNDPVWSKVIAVGILAGISSIGAWIGVHFGWWSALWALISVTALMALAFAVVTIIRWTQRHRPKLRFIGLGSSFDWCFNAPMGVCSLHTLVIQNDQISVPNTAHKVVCSILYKHDNGRDAFTAKRATWWNVNPNDTSPTTGGPRHVASLNLGGSEAQNLIIGMQQRQDRQVFSSPELNESFQDLSVGHWTLKITITSDNARPLLLTGGLTVFPDGTDRKLVYDAFVVRRTWLQRLIDG